MLFQPEVVPRPHPRGPAYWFIFFKKNLLIEENNGRITVPFMDDPSASKLHLTRRFYLGQLDGFPCFAGELAPDQLIPPHLEQQGLRQLFSAIQEDLFWVAGRAFQMINWDRTHQFCSQCGSPTGVRPREYAKTCPECGLVNYPRISPAIIVAVTKENQILLARGSRFQSNYYSVLAGFVEPGETLEECLKREVKEEVGIEVKNITYFGSQPWPFPNSLMIGFLAEYAGGVINIDKNEIREAKWFAANNLPELPNSTTIARKMIDWFANKYGDSQ